MNSWRLFDCRFPYVPQFYHHIFKKNGVSVLLLRGLRLQTFEDENYIPSEQRESWSSRICMFSWWVFMLDQKAVCCCLKTGWSANHLAVPALNVSVLSLSSAAAAPHLLWFCDGLLISCLFRTVSSVLAQLRPAWRGPTSCFNPKSWKCLIWVSAQILLPVVAPQKKQFGWFTDAGLPYCGA